MLRWIGGIIASMSLLGDFAYDAIGQEISPRADRNREFIEASSFTASVARTPPALQSGAVSEAWPERFRRDANLYRVVFVDRRSGWATGDRGAILHTADGGASWQLQQSGVTGRLEAIDFVDGLHGWAVGGQTVPGTCRTQGILLRTVDAGQTWTRVTDGFLPWLSGVHFVDQRHGYTWGSPSAMHSSSVFVTDDGGAHWRSLPGNSTGWIDGCFGKVGLASNRRPHGRLIDRDGNLSDVSRTSLTFLGRIDPEQRLPLRIGWTRQSGNLVCGNQGLVRMRRMDAGSWSTPRGLPPAKHLVEFDWSAMAIVENHVWVAGSPGTRILHSQDGGESWQLLDTGQALPIYDLEFSDLSHGWAVGALGTILVTSDGGQTWTHQQGENRRLAAMAVFGRPSTIPWEMVAQLATGEGYYLGLEVLATDAALRRLSWQTPAATRLHEATVMLGGVGANLIQSLHSPDPLWQMPAEQIRRDWDLTTESDSVSQLTEYLTRQFRTWRPELVVMPSPQRLDTALQSEDGQSRLVQQIILQAVEMAGDLQSYPGQLHTGLKPWRVSRVTSYSSDESSAGYTVSRTRMLPTLGKTVAQMAQRARSRLYGRPALLGNIDVGDRLSDYERLRIRTPGGTGRYAASVLLPAATVAADASIRRDVVTEERLTADRQKDAQRLRNLETLLRGSQRMNPAIWQQAMHLADELPDELRGELFFRSAAAGLRLGHGRAASLHLQSLAFRTEDPHHWTEAARLQLFWFLASQEAAMHWQLAALVDGSTLHIETLAKSTGNGQIARAAFLDPVRGKADLSGGKSVVAQAAVATFDRKNENGDASRAANSPALGQAHDQNAERTRQIERLIQTIQRQQPDLYEDGLFRFPLAAYQFRTAQPEVAIQYWKTQLAAQVPAAYRTWAAVELALLEANAEPPKPIWMCSLARRRPHLDGRLDDQVWTHTSEVRLESVRPDHASQSTGVQLASDREYLYLAARCEKSQTLTYAPSDQARQRDQRLTGDRLELYVDVDRDSVTAWHLSIDHRGWAIDSLNGDLSWNPTWYIATASDNESWTVEAAIPLSELCDAPVQSSTTWCLGMQRVVPGQDWQTWMQSGPVQHHPEQFGLLRFE